MRVLPVCLSILLCGCAAAQPRTGTAAQAPANWRAIATSTDRERLRDWRETFLQARQAAIGAGRAGKLAAEGSLLHPDAAIGGGIPNGTYRCRVIKLGAKSEGMLDFVSYPAFTCRISGEGSRRAFAKLTGSQRHVGQIYPGDAMRQVFLGTLVLGDEQAALDYGQDETRNVAGFVERIGPARWRLLLPRPSFESQLDVIELVPAQGAP